jgi:hypothetical protein
MKVRISLFLLVVLISLFLLLVLPKVIHSVLAVDKRVPITRMTCDFRLVKADQKVVGVQEIEVIAKSTEFIDSQSAVVGAYKVTVATISKKVVGFKDVAHAITRISLTISSIKSELPILGLMMARTNPTVDGTNIPLDAGTIGATRNVTNLTDDLRMVYGCRPPRDIKKE